MTGSYVETILVVNGSTIETSSLSNSLKEINGCEEVEVNLIVEKIFIEETRLGF